MLAEMPYIKVCIKKKNNHINALFQDAVTS